MSIHSLPATHAPDALADFGSLWRKLRERHVLYEEIQVPRVAGEVGAVVADQ
jgi:hypothetical protein